MKYIGVVLSVLFCVATISIGCKTQSKATASTVVEEKEVETKVVSNIALYDKPLNVVKAHVTEQRWQLIYSIGGMTGRDKNTFDSTYYTLKADGKMLMEHNGKTKEHPYEWKQQRDIYTGDTINVVSGIVQWKVNGIDNDTLRVLDNYVDGYTYSLIRAK